MAREEFTGVQGHGRWLYCEKKNNDIIREVVFNVPAVLMGTKPRLYSFGSPWPGEHVKYLVKNFVTAMVTMVVISSQFVLDRHGFKDSEESSRLDTADFLSVIKYEKEAAPTPLGSASKGFRTSSVYNSLKSILLQTGPSDVVLPFLVGGFTV
ncbi:hypothetical protein EVAR_5015_1 [Eumeta japonica]|uniref:Uncharacterized protein n=1 Tax=Eumeta variegata TaxID=151549 RepID=A0A4C1SUP5_EUMVA|nr:hypothetical protein EVAR_5015_1 [Eumeta japonica]